MDLVVDDKVVVEIKCVENIDKIHIAQVLTYLKLSGVRIGLFLNFHAAVLREGIRRLAL